jgi:hypothetical protein
MITRKYQDVLRDMSNFLDTKEEKELNDDLITIFNFVIVLYSRNVFKYNNKWERIKIIYDFDYDYINEHKTVSKLLHMQHELTEFARLFKSTKQKRDIERY